MMFKVFLLFMTSKKLFKKTESVQEIPESFIMVNIQLFSIY